MNHQPFIVIKSNERFLASPMLESYEGKMLLNFTKIFSRASTIRLNQIYSLLLDIHIQPAECEFKLIPSSVKKYFRNNKDYARDFENLLTFYFILKQSRFTESIDDAYINDPINYNLGLMHIRFTLINGRSFTLITNNDNRFVLYEKQFIEAAQIYDVSSPVRKSVFLGFKQFIQNA